ncbi:MAG TPA: acetate--CoA ligase [Burkholderiales bacterium]|nr:acetate--CoA ligase [Burkholderiales bacterium]
MSDIYEPLKRFKEQANLNSKEYALLIEKAENNYSKFWADLAKEKISWQKNFTKILNDEKAPFYKWFEDGILNVSYNCLDKHLDKIPNKTAIIFESDDGKVEKISYKELYYKVCKFANGLKSLGIKKSDRVIIYMPHGIEAIIAMQSCARIGAIHSVVFAGFSAKSVSDRIIDAQAKFLITSNASRRGGKTIPLKDSVDNAIKLLGNNNTILKVIIYNKINHKINLVKDRDIWCHDLVANQIDSCPPEIVESEHPLFILYTSGSTGKPKGVQHSSAGYLLGSILTMQWIFDIKESDIFWCTADVGWITGHTYVCYGPLATGATQVIYEGIPTYPDASRFWQIIDKHKVSIFYTAPTAIRSLIKIDAKLPTKFDLSSLRLLGSVGEPINPAAWLWYYEIVGKKNCPIVDTWWQTETGSIMLSPIPGVTNLKSGSCTFPIPGIFADIVDENGKEVKNNKGGYLVIKKPFPMQLRNIWNNPNRYLEAYYPKNIMEGKYYVAGDYACKDKEGYFWILGRTDDIIKVSGHRLSTMEIESSLNSHPKIAESAVVGKPDEIKGESICAFVVCKGATISNKEDSINLTKELQEWVKQKIGPIAKPDEIRFTDNLPKTRSGKIMRRLLRSIAKNENITGDTSTLENPNILENLKK